MNRLLVFTCFICLFIAGPFQEVEGKGLGNHRIIGGETINIENASYQIGILKQINETQVSYMCGGSILSKNLILTAGHCADLEPGRYAIHSGSSVWYQDGQMHKVVKIIRHENYKVEDHGRPDNDIAIMKISPEFELDGKTEKIITLADKDDQVKSGEQAYLSGWGYINEQEEKIPDQLQGLSIKIMDFEECSKDYKHLGRMTEYSICAKVADGDRDMCNGDSGGPLVVDGKQVGIVSWSGPGCAVPGLPGVYADVAKYRDWIDQHIESL